MIRFVAGPEGDAVPDLAARLPGRGFWLSASRDMVNTASAKNLFSKAARRKLSAPPDLADRIEALLARRCGELLGLARRAGQAIVGFEKVKSELKARRAAASLSGVVLLAASDGAADGRAKIRALVGETGDGSQAGSGPALIEALTAEELGAAFGRDHAVHVLLLPGRLAEAVRSEAARLSGFRPARGTN
ncbi:hypothetical protein GALL_87860 [mine drainage metagenome]|uniref:YlxR domain-containing protein n=1 Tax=mine drainage metagenome TaxID=410659 RepID=A0A1J5SMJ9_9ZZZZ